MQDTNQSEAARQAIDYWQILKNRYGVLLLTFLSRLSDRCGNHLCNAQEI